MTILQSITLCLDSQGQNESQTRESERYLYITYFFPNVIFQRITNYHELNVGLSICLVFVFVIYYLLKFK